jgi:hypothetical protein
MGTVTYHYDASKAIGDDMRTQAQHAYDCDDPFVGIRGRHLLTHYAKRIDSETVMLPKDANGVPIHVGDALVLPSGKGAIACTMSLDLSCTAGTSGTDACLPWVVMDQNGEPFQYWRCVRQDDSIGQVIDTLELLQKHASPAQGRALGDVVARLRRLNGDEPSGK